MYGGMGLNGDSGSISGPQMLPIRSTTGWTPLPCRLCVVSGSTAFLKAMIRCGTSTAGSASSSCQRVSVRPMYTPRLLATANLRTPQVRAASSALSRPTVSARKKETGVLAGDAASQVNDVADVLAAGEGEEGLPVGDVERLYGDPAGEERRDFGPVMRGDDDLVSAVDERAGGVGADHAQPAGDEDHRTTS